MVVFFHLLPGGRDCPLSLLYRLGAQGLEKAAMDSGLCGRAGLAHLLSHCVS